MSFISAVSNLVCSRTHFKRKVRISLNFKSVINMFNVKFVIWRNLIWKPLFYRTAFWSCLCFQGRTCQQVRMEMKTFFSYNASKRVQSSQWQITGRLSGSVFESLILKNGFLNPSWCRPVVPNIFQFADPPKTGVTLIEFLADISLKISKKWKSYVPF